MAAVVASDFDVVSGEGATSGCGIVVEGSEALARVEIPDLQGVVPGGGNRARAVGLTAMPET